MSDDEQWRAPTWVTIGLSGGDTEDPSTIKPSIVTLRILAEVIEKWGIGQARDLLLFGASLVKSDTAEVPSSTVRLILDMARRSTIGRAENLEEFLLWRSYTWLREKQIDRAQAARFASDVLDREISTDAWRMAVDRWAKKQYFPKVEVRVRRTPKGDDKD